jgi:hypothetical protein
MYFYESLSFIVLQQVEQMISMGKIIRHKGNLLGGNSKSSMRTQQGMVNILAATYGEIKFSNDDPDGCSGLFNSAPNNVTDKLLLSQAHDIISDGPEYLMSLTNSDSPSFINPAIDNFFASSQSSQINSLTSDGSDDLASVAMNVEAFQSQDTIESIHLNSVSNHSSNISEPSQAINIATEPPYQLTKEEFGLLGTILKDTGILRKNGDFDWDKVHNFFNEEAIKPDNNIYNRTKERLIGSYRKRKRASRQNSELTSATIAQVPSDIPDSVSLDVHSASHSTNLTSISATSSHEPLPLSHITDSPSLDIHSASHSTNLTSVPATSSHEPNLLSHTENVPPRAIGPITYSSRVVVPFTHRNDDLDTEERDFVHTYGKDRMNEGKDVDKSALWKAYRIRFPQWSRDSDKIKKCWDNRKREDAKKKRKIST